MQVSFRFHSLRSSEILVSRSICTKIRTWRFQRTEEFFRKLTHHPYLNGHLGQSGTRYRPQFYKVGLRPSPRSTLILLDKIPKNENPEKKFRESKFVSRANFILRPAWAKCTTFCRISILLMLFYSRIHPGKNKRRFVSVCAYLNSLVFVVASKIELFCKRALLMLGSFAFVALWCLETCLKKPRELHPSYPHKFLYFGGYW